MTQFKTNYMDDALFNLEALVRRARKDLKAAMQVGDFDTLVGTGFSGGLVVPVLARSLKVKFALVRKESDDSHHGRGRLLGEIGERWLFVDDFVSSGRTKRYVIDKVQTSACSMYVGDYLYAHIGKDYTGAPRQRYFPIDQEV